jgi:hypothetical protein
VSPVKYELGFYIPEDGILHSHCRENLKSYLVPLYGKVLVRVSAYFVSELPTGFHGLSGLLGGKDTLYSQHVSANVPCEKPHPRVR